MRSRKIPMVLTSGARRPLSGDDRFFSMADSAASTQSRPQRTASKKRRQATVSTETENKLARAARSAQRLAQLSDASRDDSTLDLFPDDPTRATLEAMNIDVRQGTLHGFELPDVVLAAVGAIDADGLSLEAKAARRAPRTTKSEEPAPVYAQLSGLEPEAVEAPTLPVGGVAFDDAKAATEASAEEKPATSARDAAAPLTSAMAAATVARSVTALRQAAESGATTGMQRLHRPQAQRNRPCRRSASPRLLPRRRRPRGKPPAPKPRTPGLRKLERSARRLRRKPRPGQRGRSLRLKLAPAWWLLDRSWVQRPRPRRVMLPHRRLRMRQPQALLLLHPLSGKPSAPKLLLRRCVPRLNSTARGRRHSRIPSTPYMA